MHAFRSANNIVRGLRLRPHLLAAPAIHHTPHGASKSRHVTPAAHVVVAAAAAEGSAPSVQERLKVDMKQAMKAKDQARLDAIRFLQAALKQREIELREKSLSLSEEDVIKVIQKLSKQRQDSIESYKAGGRDDLVAKEQQELELLRTYLPAMLSVEELQAFVDEVAAELGASSIKQMGAVIKGVQAKCAGQADSKQISDLVKAKLQA